MSTVGQSLCIALAVMAGSSPVASAQNIRELARQHATRNPGVPLEQPAPPADYLPKSIEELTTESDVVLEGRLSGAQSYLAPSEDRILTDFRILQPKLIAGHLMEPSKPVPGESIPLILTVYGGEVVVEGVTVRGTDNNRQAIKDGGRYLLFLKASRSGAAGKYEIYYGAAFEIVNNDVKPLLKEADYVFTGGVEPRMEELVSRIQKVARRQ